MCVECKTILTQEYIRDETAPRVAGAAGAVGLHENIHWHIYTYISVNMQLSKGKRNKRRLGRNRD